jgi:small subunit ribosomal protein S4
MGKPKFSRKKYETPSHPWKQDRIKSENELIKKYGLKNKREVWKAETRLRKYRGQARELLAKIGTSDAQSKKESNQLLIHLSRMNILPINSTLDDVLALETESILSRRLQTLTYLKGLANTPDQARQLISHGHIGIGNRRVTIPSYMITKDEEGEIGYTKDSPLNDLMHPARPKADFKSRPIVKDEKPKVPDEEVKEPKKEEKKPDETPKEEIKEEKKPDETPKEGIKEEKTEKTQKETDNKQELKDEKIDEQRKTEEKEQKKTSSESEDKKITKNVEKQKETPKPKKTDEKTQENKEQQKKEEKKEGD